MHSQPHPGTGDEDPQRGGGDMADDDGAEAAPGQEPEAERHHGRPAHRGRTTKATAATALADPSSRLRNAVARGKGSTVVTRSRARSTTPAAAPKYPP